MKIKDREISNNHQTFVIAEVGSNCKNDLDLAKEHISAAKSCGADAVKFQSLNMSKLYLRPSKSVVDLYQKINLDEDIHSELKDYADKIGITFFSSPTYLEAVDILLKLDVDLFKIASAQVGTFPRLIDKVASTKKPTIFSTGLSNYENLANTVNIFENYNHQDYAILHCNSLYPTPYDKVFLDRIEVYRGMFNVPIGFSDHTHGIAVILAAVALKANIIEKHFKLDEITGTPDAEFSIGVNEFSTMVSSIRAVEKSLGNKPRNTIEKDEKSFQVDISYKLVLKKRKNIGDRIMINDFDYLRDKDGIDASFDSFVAENFVFSREMEKGVIIRWSDLMGF